MSDAGDKLARTRLAIIEHVHRKEDRHDRHERREEQRAQRAAAAAAGVDVDDYEQEGGGGIGGWLASAKRAAGSWWRHHPAHMGVELATPMLQQYAAQKPAQFLGIAAAVGALFVVVRPWRLISVTGLLVAIVKSSQLSSVVMSAMSAADFQKDHQVRR